MLTDSKHSLCLLLEKLQILLSIFPTINLQKEKRSIDNSYLIFSIIIQFELSLERANQLYFIEPTAVNQIVLIGIARRFVSFYNSEICHISSKEVFHTWTAGKAKSGVTLKLNRIANSLIHRRRLVHIETLEKLLAKQEEPTFSKLYKPPNPKIKQTFSELSIEEIKNDKPLTFEQAVLIIQKMERFYKAARRRSIELHRTNVKRTIITEEDAAIIIQAKVRGYLARRRVVQIRNEELDLLGLSFESVMKQKLSEEKREFLNRSSINLGRIKVIISFSESDFLKDRRIEDLLDLLNSNASIEDIRQEPMPVANERSELEKMYSLLLQRGILRKPVNVKKTCGIASYISPVKYKQHVFEFDIQKFLDPIIIYPLMLSSWHIPQKPIWTLLVGNEKSGKSRWAEEVAGQTSATYLYVTARTVMIAPRILIQRIMKLNQIDKTVLVAIDRLEHFQKQKSNTTTKTLFRNFLHQLKQTNVFVVGMSRSSELDSAIKCLFEAEINLGYPDFSATFDICADLISLGWSNNQLRKIPATLWDVLIGTTALNCGEVISYIRNQWFQTPKL